MSFLKDRQSNSTRAQALRQKRAPTSAVPDRKVNKPVTQPARKVSPVVSRHTNYGTPSRRVVGTQPKRKVYYRVGANGVETRLPAVPIINFSWQWVSGAAAVGMLILALLFTNLSMFKVSSIDIKGIQRLTVDDLLVVVRSNAGSIFTLDKQELTNSLTIAFPELADINVAVSLPNSLKISARERQPIMAWKTETSQIWIDAEGVVIPQRGEVENLLTIKSEVDAPLSRPVDTSSDVIDYAMMLIETKTDPAKAEETINYLDPSVFNAAIQLSALMPQGAKLVYDPISGMGWRDPGGWRVFFGNDLTKIQFKQAEYLSIIAKMSELGISPVMVSVEHIDAPYFRTE